jgi:alkylation response protein AidB-like acyl-CoA dehydrogenase
VYDGVFVADDHLIGEPHGSWKQIMRQLEHERGGVDRIVSNRALFLDTLATADLSDPQRRSRAAALEARFRIGRLLVLRALSSTAPPGTSALTKVFCTEVEQAVSEFCVDVAGLPGLCRGRTMRSFAYAPAYSIQGGGNGILRTVLAERVLGLPR